MATMVSQQPPVLVVVDAFHRRSALEQGLGLVPCESVGPVEVDACMVNTYFTTPARISTVLITVIRPPNGNLECFLEKTRRLYSRFRGPVFVFNAGLARAPIHMRREMESMDGLHVNPPIAMLAACLQMYVTDVQRDGMLRGMTDLAREIVGMGLMHGRPLLPAAAEDDHDLELGLRNSIEDQERREAMKAALPPTPIPRSWESVLKHTGEPIQVGKSVCCVCRDMRATICFVDCNHLVTCDGCVREMKGRTRGGDEEVKCPVCRTEVRVIARPIFSEEEPEVAPESPTKRARQ